MKILFIDSKALFIDGLKSLLEVSGLSINTCHTKDIKSGLDLISKGAEVELIFVDINVYEGNNDYLSKGLQELSTFAPVIIISEIESLEFEEMTINAGASGFICKTNSKHSLFDAVRVVSNGGVYRDYRTLENSNDKYNIHVTTRQYEVLRLLPQGLLNKQIANELSISINTVNAHLHEIFNRLHVTNRTAAVQSAHEIGLI